MRPSCANPSYLEESVAVTVQYGNELDNQWHAGHNHPMPNDFAYLADANVVACPPNATNYYSSFDDATTMFA